MEKQRNKKSIAYAYREGYNNPNSFDQEKLLDSKSPFAKDVIRGITDRARDVQNGTVQFKH